MKSGLLWYDADPKKPIEAKIAEAAQRYYEKFGVRPNTCFVNPSALPQGEALPTKVEAAANGKAARPSPGRTVAAASALRVTAKATILPNHIWLGISDN